MKKQSYELPYDENDETSILEYAGRLTGHTFVEIGVWNPEAESRIKNKKGTFGQILEEGYFYIPNNSSPEPDFKEVGIELKSTPMRRLSNRKLTSKERLVLNIINYMTINKLEFEGSFKKKNERLLVVFYEWSNDKEFYNYKIEKVVFWTFPEEDLRIIQEDWNTIAGMVSEGKAHQLSERLTRYLAACTKGVGHDKDMREQPHSETLAKQRALSLKQSYVNKIFRESIYKKHKGVFVNDIERRSSKDSQSLFDNMVWSGSESFEDYVIQYFDRFVGKKCKEIEVELGIHISKSKAYREVLTRRMMGIEKKKIKEFEDSGTKMKTIFLTSRGVPQESMSFPSFKYRDIANQTWETSEFSEALDKRFLFIIFQQKEYDEDDIFIGAFFWSMSYDDLMEAKRVWEITAYNVQNSNMDGLPKSKDSEVAHVRPHGRNSKDVDVALDGKEYIKRSFWLNRTYIEKIVKDSGILERINNM